VSRSASATPQKDPATGTWWFVIDSPSGGSRRRQLRRRGFKTKAAAQAALDELRVAARRGGYVPRSNQTLGEFLDEWLRSVRPALEVSTLESYERNLRLHVRPQLGDTRLQKLDAGSLNGLYADLLADGRVDGRGGLSPRSVRYIHNTLHGAFAAAVKWGRLERNPADLADPPSKRLAERRVMKPWTADELTQFLDSEAGDRYYYVWVFLATTGCRRGEALGLRWQDVDLARSRVSIRQTINVIKGTIHRSPRTKTDRPRVIRLDRGTVDALRAWKRRQAEERLAARADYHDEDLVFCLADGRPYNPNTFSWIFDDRVRRHGLPRIRLHDLRHTWATLALAEGVHPRVVQERLGHSSVGVTLDIYSHVTPGLESDAADRIASLFLRRPARDG
jgi:integrase